MTKNKNKNIVTIDIIDSIKQSFSHIDSAVTGLVTIFFLFSPLIMMSIIAFKLIANVIYHVRNAMYLAMNDRSGGDIINITNCNNTQLAELIVNNIKSGYNICKSDYELRKDTEYNKIYNIGLACDNQMRKLKKEISNLSTIQNSDMYTKYGCCLRISNLLEDIGYYQKNSNKSYIFLTDEQDNILHEFVLRMITLDYGIFDDNLDQNTDFYDLDKHNTTLINLFNDKIFVSNLRKCCLLKQGINAMNK